jgi:hypothetical protein
MLQVTFGDFTTLAKQRHWSAEFLAATFRGKIEQPSEFFHRLLSGAAPATLIVYRSVLDLYENESGVNNMQTASSRPTCACGCGAAVFDRKKWATPGCKKRMQRRAA